LLGILEFVSSLNIRISDFWCSTSDLTSGSGTGTYVQKKTIEREIASVMLHKVVFLDRDGVINRDSPDYIKGLGEFVFLPGSLEALRALTEQGFSCIVVTNQSALARGLMAPEALDAIHRHMTAAVAAAGSRIVDIFICPHLPGEECLCRKPKPGLLHAAQRKYRIDLSSAAMIGDSAKDIRCALAAGVKTAILVRTGNGRHAEGELRAQGLVADFIGENLKQAADWIIRQPLGASLPHPRESL
jgi:D-glycero-D-manno-heptose 1,7-bisphosphate phosphatase